MDASRKFYLISETYTKDTLGQYIRGVTKIPVYGDVKEGASRSEFASAGERGLKPSCMVRMFKYDYHGETLAEISLYGETKTMTVYRTYSENDIVELYLSERVGDGNTPG